MKTLYRDTPPVVPPPEGDENPCQTKYSEESLEKLERVLKQLWRKNDDE